MGGGEGVNHRDSAGMMLQQRAADPFGCKASLVTGWEAPTADRSPLKLIISKTRLKLAATHLLNGCKILPQHACACCTSLPTFPPFFSSLCRGFPENVNSNSIKAVVWTRRVGLTTNTAGSDGGRLPSWVIQVYANRTIKSSRCGSNWLSFH